MKINEIVLTGLLLAVVARASQVNKAQATVAANYAKDPQNWFDDQWARLMGRDLTLDGNHPAPGYYDVFGMSGEMRNAGTIYL